MSSNQENIEAKLAAYVDGELSGADREEIERHLNSNPAHRRLIVELSQTRALLQNLPRAKAPADVLESLRSQLERSALLGSPEQLTGDDSYKVGFGTQFRAIAAILVLTFGLAAVVYYVLPRGEPKIELAGGPATDKTAAVAIEESLKPSPLPDMTSSARTDSAMDTVAGAGGLTDGISKAKETLAAAAGSMQPGAAFKLESKPAPTDAVTPELHRQLVASGVSDTATYIVVDTQQGSLASASVSNYLSVNRLTWEQIQPVDFATPAKVAEKIDLSMMLTRPAEVARRMRSGVAEENLSESQMARAKLNLDTAAATTPNPGPVDANRMDLSPQAIGSKQNARQAQQQQFAAINTPGQMIVARNLSRAQLAELNGLLTQQNAGAVSNYRAEQRSSLSKDVVKDATGVLSENSQQRSREASQEGLPGGSGAVATANAPSHSPSEDASTARASAAASIPPATTEVDTDKETSQQRIRSGDSLTFIISDAAHGEIIITAEVDPAGLVPGMPQLGGTMVSGLTLDELNASLAGRLREVNQAQNLASDAPPRATRITPAVRDDVEMRDALATAPQRIIAQPIEAGAVTTDERMDVVVIVRGPAAASLALPEDTTVPDASIPNDQSPTAPAAAAPMLPEPVAPVKIAPATNASSPDSPAPLPETSATPGSSAETTPTPASGAAMPATTQSSVPTHATQP